MSDIPENKAQKEPVVRMMRCRNEGFEIKWQRQSVRYIAEKSKNHIWRKLQ